MNRRTFATNGRRMEARLVAGEGNLGEIVDADESVEIHWDVRARDELDEILIYRNGHVLKKCTNPATPSAAGTIVDRPAEAGETSYFVVARSVDEGLLISSPVWIRR